MNTPTQAINKLEFLAREAARLESLRGKSKDVKEIEDRETERKRNYLLAFNLITREVLGGSSKIPGKVEAYLGERFESLRNPWQEGENFLRLKKLVSDEEMKEINDRMRAYEERFYAILRVEYD